MFSLARLKLAGLPFLLLFLVPGCWPAFGTVGDVTIGNNNTITVLADGGDDDDGGPFFPLFPTVGNVNIGSNNTITVIAP